MALLGYTDSSLLGEMVDALGARDGAAVFALIDRVVESGHDPRRFATDLLERFRDLVVLAAVPDALDKGLVNVAPEAAEQMKDQASRLGPAELTRAADILNGGLTEMRGATAPRLLLELMCARVLLPATDGDQGTALLARLEQVERSAPHPSPATNSQRTPGGAAPVPPAPQSHSAPQVAQAPQQPASRPTPEPQQRAPEPQRPASEPERPTHSVSEPAGRSGGARGSAGPSAASASGGAVDLGRIQGAWHQILEAVKNRRRFTWMVLTGSDVGPVGVEGNTVLLGFSRPNEAKGFGNSGSDQVVAAAIQEVLGAEVRVAAGGANAGPAAPAPARGPEPPRPAEPVGWDAPAPEPVRPAEPVGRDAPAPEPVRPAEPVGWDAPAPEPARPAEPAPASESEPASAGPPPDKIVTGLQEPPPDPFEDAAAAPPPEHADPEPRHQASKPADPGPPARETAGEFGENEPPGKSGVALIEDQLGGKLIDEIEHEAPGG